MKAIRRVHARLLQKRISVWGGEISDRAADLSLQFYELCLAAYLIAISGVVCYLILASAGLGLAGGIALGIFTLLAFLSFAVATQRGRQAGHQIAQQYGLAPKSWTSMKLKTPGQFEAWLAKQRPVPHPE